MTGISIGTTGIPGLLRIDIPSSSDARGSFNKTFVEGEYASAGIATRYAEEYYTVSAQGTLRGMHLQLPPRDLDKVVFCLSGAVFDVVLDLRRGSPTYLGTEVFTLNESGFGLCIPSGCAHGFAVLSESACLAYKVTCGYSAESDAGLLWSSLSVDWPVREPVVSPRDSEFLSLADFDSPFVYAPGANK